MKCYPILYSYLMIKSNLIFSDLQSPSEIFTVIMVVIIKNNSSRDSRSSNEGAEMSAQSSTPTIPDSVSLLISNSNDEADQEKFSIPLQAQEEAVAEDLTNRKPDHNHL